MIFISGIYKITSPSGKIYIGQSKNIKLRWAGHKSKAKYDRYRCKLYNSFKKHGFDNHTFETIHYIDEEISQVKFDEIEQYYIDQYRDSKIKLLNMKEAGCYGKHTEETKQKLREINLGKKYGDETRRKIGLASKGHKRLVGIKHTEQTIINKSKPVLQFTKNGDFIKEFIGAKQAQNLLNIPQTNISENCRGKRKSAGGYVWKFKQNY